MKIYNAQSTRFQNRSYANGCYFVTICTQDRHHFFGNIVQTETQTAFLQKTDEGQIVERVWAEIPIQFPFAATGDFILMPNHLHGILTLSAQNTALSPDSDARNPMKHENLARIVRWFKGKCSYEVRQINPHFAWQSNYHEHVILSDVVKQKIERYIKNNPQKWLSDRLFSNK